MKTSDDYESTDYCTKNCEYEDGYPCIYIDRCKFERKALERLTKEMTGLCLTCPLRTSSHALNCIECCPIQAVIEHLAGLTGKTVVDGTQRVTYTHTVICNTGRLPK